MKMLPRYVLEAVSLETGLTMEMVAGRCALPEEKNARRLYYHACRELGLGSEVTGRLIGRDHSTVVQVIRYRDLTDVERSAVNAVKERACEICEKKTEAFVQDVGKALDRHRSSILERVQ